MGASSPVMHSDMDVELNTVFSHYNLNQFSVIGRVIHVLLSLGEEQGWRT